MSPGSRAWDESHSRILLTQAQSFTRFGDGAKKQFAIEVTNPGAMAAEKTHEETEAKRGRRVTVHSAGADRSDSKPHCVPAGLHWHFKLAGLALSLRLRLVLGPGSARSACDCIR